MVTIVLWFNPLILLFRKSIKENHEYLADRGVIARGFDRSRYQAVLINHAVGTEVFALANGFSKSLIKKRITMMSKMKSSKISALKPVLMIPVLLFLLFAFAEPQYIIAQTEEQNTAPPDTIKDSDTPVFVTEEMPEFPGGMLALRKFVAQNIRYPKDAQEVNIEGKVYVRFVVKPDGSVANSEVIRGVYPSLDAEALRVVNMLPKWKPASCSGKSQAVYFTLPVNFSLGDEKIDKKAVEEEKEVNQNQSVIANNTDKSVYFVVDEMPEFPGGEIALRKFIAQQTEYPKEAREAGIGGKIYVQFAIMEDGSVDKVKTVRGINEVLNNEGMRVVKIMPKWKPGKKDGKAVPVWFTVPIVFEAAPKDVNKKENHTKEIKSSEEEIDVNVYDNEEPIFMIVEEMPEYPGGIEALRHYIARNIKYPKEAQQNGWQEKVYVRFVVNKDGSVSDVETIRGSHEVLNQEAERVISTLKDWKPGKQRGKLVKVFYTIPINFALNEVEKRENDKPLIILNGKEYKSDINTISPANIENITVLKGNRAIDNYGDKGSSGVIEIETKNKNATVEENLKSRVGEEQSKQIAKIYPNPNNGVFSVELTNKPVDAKIDVFDMSGKRVLSQNINKESSVIDLSSQPTAVYLIKIYNQHEVQFLHLIKE